MSDGGGLEPAYAFKLGARAQHKKRTFPTQPRLRPSRHAAMHARLGVRVFLSPWHIKTAHPGALGCLAWWRAPNPPRSPHTCAGDSSGRRAAGARGAIVRFWPAKLLLSGELKATRPPGPALWRCGPCQPLLIPPPHPAPCLLHPCLLHTAAFSICSWRQWWGPCASSGPPSLATGCGRA